MSKARQGNESPLTSSAALSCSWSKSPRKGRKTERSAPGSLSAHSLIRRSSSFTLLFKRNVIAPSQTSGRKVRQGQHKRRVNSKQQVECSVQHKTVHVGIDLYMTRSCIMDDLNTSRGATKNNKNDPFDRTGELEVQFPGGIYMYVHMSVFRRKKVLVKSNSNPTDDMT